MPAGIQFLRRDAPINEIPLGAINGLPFDDRPARVTDVAGGAQAGHGVRRGAVAKASRVEKLAWTDQAGDLIVSQMKTGPSGIASSEQRPKTGSNDLSRDWMVGQDTPS